MIGPQTWLRFSSATISLDLLTLDHYRTIWHLPDVRSATLNTFVLAVLSGAACVVIGFLISFLEVRRAGRGARLLAMLAVLAAVIAGGPARRRRRRARQSSRRRQRRPGMSDGFSTVPAREAATAAQ
ncbi:hypothetical protein DPM13_16480 [Paracoccus mutanolyticus]|uniref:ABC transmembrane type-1 domain-containing protein n=1 Tax=Paracoccus mutanolyticus TaxID=1499308 RepID=A0ABN5MB28_9RHOB|nr:hypothetical protein DPM13_16480 [Paracoccus mutanolyticus]